MQGNPCQHPIILLRGIPYTDLSALLQFMYNGEVKYRIVYYNQLSVSFTIDKGCVPLRRACQFSNLDSDEGLIFLGYSSMDIKNGLQKKKIMFYLRKKHLEKSNI